MANRGRALADRIVTYFGDAQPGIGRGIELQNAEQFAAIGFDDYADLDRALLDLQAAGLMDFVSGVANGVQKLVQGNRPPMLLTLHGWDRYERLKRSNPESTTAFMAMQFGDEQMDRIYRDHLCPAVDGIGYQLQTVQDTPEAGLIDYRIRLQVTASRFVIADVTHGNPGVYFEAGYAGGIRRPVIYTCRADAFAPKAGHPHFDVNHHLCVKWDDPPTETQLEDLAL